MLSVLNRLPLSLQVEAGVIGSAISKPDFLLQIEWLKPQYFQDELNAAVFWAINQLVQEGIENIDDFNVGKIINDQYNLQYVINSSATCNSLSINSLKEYFKTCIKVARPTIEEYRMLLQI